MKPQRPSIFPPTRPGLNPEQQSEYDELLGILADKIEAFIELNIQAYRKQFASHFFRPEDDNSYFFEKDQTPTQVLLRLKRLGKGQVIDFVSGIYAQPERLAAFLDKTDLTPEQDHEKMKAWLEFSTIKSVVALIEQARNEYLILKYGYDTLMSGYLKREKEKKDGKPVRGFFHAECMKVIDKMKQALYGPATVIYADLDNFKMVNDYYNHQVGDLALGHIARVAAKETKDVPEMVYARDGGEEVIFIAPNTVVEDPEKMMRRLQHLPPREGGAEKPDGVELGGRILQAIRSTPLYLIYQADSNKGMRDILPVELTPERYFELITSHHLQDLPSPDKRPNDKVALVMGTRQKKPCKLAVAKLQFTMSMGLAACKDTDEEAFDRAIAKADSQMYEAKQSGKDRYAYDTKDTI